MNLTKVKQVTIALGAAAVMATPSLAQNAPDSFADIVEDIGPSVVSITTNVTVAGGGPQIQLPPEMPDFFRDLFENNPNFQQQAPREGIGLGSGFVIDEEGYIVTNNHVIEDANEITVEFYDGTEMKAELIGTDPQTDVAVLKVDTDKKLQASEFGNSDEMRVGDWVVAVGNPLGQTFSVSAGIVSARTRSLGGTYDDYIQTDAAINRGNSGGPLYNLDGEVIGVNTAILSPDGGSIGIGFAMSSRVVSKVVEQIREYGSTRRGYLGVEIRPVTDDIAEAIGMSKAEGAMVQNVPEGPSRSAGLEAGDVIVKFDGQDIEDVNELLRIVADTEVGKTVEVEVFRQGEGLMTKEVTLARREDSEVVASNDTEDEPSIEDGETVLGMTLLPLTEENARMYEIESAGGLLVQAVEPDSVADSRAIRAGDVIRSVNRRDVNSVDDFKDVVEQAEKSGRDSVLLVVDRDGVGNFIALPIE